MSFPEEEAFLNYSYSYDEDYEVEEPCRHATSAAVAAVLAPYVQSVICALGVLGNALVIVTYARYKRARSMTDVFLLNVAVADLLFALTLPLLVSRRLWAWPAGAAVCKLLRGSYSVNLYSGALLLACVSADRYVAIVQARRSFRLRSLAYGRLICGAVWGSALLLSLPTFYFYAWYRPSHAGAFFLTEELRPNATASPAPPQEEEEEAQHVCEFRFSEARVARLVKVAVPGTQAAVGFFLPLAVMSGCYGAVAVTLTRAKNFQRHKAVRVVLAVVAVFVACHLPYNAALLYDTAGLFRQRGCGDSDGRQTALALTETLAHTHCCLNPLLYAFVGVRFRGHFRRIFRDLWCLGKKALAPRRHSRTTSQVFLSTARRSTDGGSEHASSFTM